MLAASDTESGMDEESLRKMDSKTLRQFAHEVVEARNGMEALETATGSDHPAIDLLVTDVIMPEMSGAVPAERLQKPFSPQFLAEKARDLLDETSSLRQYLFRQCK